MTTYYLDPNGDVSAVNLFKKSGGTENIWDALDSGVRQPTWTDPWDAGEYVWHPHDVGGAGVGRVACSSFTLPVAEDVTTVTAWADLYGGANYTARLRVFDAAGSIVADTGDVVNADRWTSVTWTPPSSLSQADIDGLSIGLVLDAAPEVMPRPRCFSCYLKITTIAITITPESLTKSATYAVRRSVSAALPAHYAVTRPRALELPAAYRVQRPESLGRPAGYAVQRAQEMALPATYAVVAPFALARGASYKVVTPSGLARGSAYAVSRPDTLVLPASYAVRTPAGLTRPATYAVLSGTTPVSIQARTAAAPSLVLSLNELELAPGAVDLWLKGPFSLYLEIAGSVRRIPDARRSHLRGNGVIYDWACLSFSGSFLYRQDLPAPRLVAEGAET